MILANIKDAKKYCAIHPNFKPVFEFLSAMTKDSKEGMAAEDYRVNFSGMTCDTADQNPDGTPKVFEAHRDYMDIHYCISGSEGIGYAHVDELTPITEYNKQDDYLLLVGDYRKVILHEGDFCVVFPEDAHIPMMKGDSEGALLKAVAKIKL